MKIYDKEYRRLFRHTDRKHINVYESTINGNRVEIHNKYKTRSKS